MSFRHPSERDSRDPLVSGGGFTDDEDLRRAREETNGRSSKISLVFNLLMAAGMIAMLVMFYIYFAENHHNNELLKKVLANHQEIMENQQDIDVTHFYQRKVLEALYTGPPDVVWPPIVDPPILFPSPSPVPSPSPGGARSAHEDSLDPVHLSARTHQHGAIHMTAGKPVGASLEEQRATLLDLLEVRIASAKRSGRTIGETVDALWRRGDDNDDDDDCDDDDDDCNTPTPSPVSNPTPTPVNQPVCPGCACTAEIAAAVHNITTNVTSQITYTNSLIATTNSMIIAYHYGDIIPRLDGLAECCDENTDLLNELTEAERAQRIDNDDWRFWGRTPDNHMYAGPDASQIDVDNAVDLEFKCDLPFAVNGNSKASNAEVVIVGDLALFPNTESGDVFCYNRRTCGLVWHKNAAFIFQDNIFDEGPTNASLSNIPVRGSTSVYRNKAGQERVFIAGPSDRFGCVHNGNSFCLTLSSYVIALDLYTGEYVFHTKATDQAVPAEFIAHFAGSMTISGEYGYIGTSSFSNVFTLFNLPATFIGQVMKIHLEDGSLVWKQNTLPSLGAGSWAGASVWSKPGVDEEAGIVVVGTGNMHFMPEDAQQCFLDYPDIGNSSTWSRASRFCHDQMVAAYEHPLPDDALIGLNITTGEFIWVYKSGGIDCYNVACQLMGAGPSAFGPQTRIEPGGPGTGCHGFMGPDWDYGGTMVIVRRNNRALAIAGAKSGVVSAVDLYTGTLYWQLDLGPSGTTSGIHWGGSYSDATGMFYGANAGNFIVDGNTGARESAYNKIAGGVETCEGGTIHAIDVESGIVVWESFDPWSNNTYTGTFNEDCRTGDDLSRTTLIDLFKADWVFHSASGETFDRTLTATLGEPCRREDTTSLDNGTFDARLHGPLAISNGVLAAASMTGNVYLHDTITGNCVKALSCERGAIYGGVTFSDNQMFAQCGYEKFGLGKAGNMTRMWELSA